MNQPPAEATTTKTFVVRFWHEYSDTESRWRGRVEHVQSGRRQDFLSLEEMLGFLQQMGVPLVQVSNGGTVKGDFSSPHSPK